MWNVICEKPAGLGHGAERWKVTNLHEAYALFATYSEQEWKQWRFYHSEDKDDGWADCLTPKSSTQGARVLHVTTQLGPQDTPDPSV